MLSLLFLSLIPICLDRCNVIASSAKEGNLSVASSEDSTTTFDSKWTCSDVLKTAGLANELCSKMSFRDYLRTLSISRCRGLDECTLTPINSQNWTTLDTELIGAVNMVTFRLRLWKSAVKNAAQNLDVGLTSQPFKNSQPSIDRHEEPQLHRRYRRMSEQNLLKETLTLKTKTSKVHDTHGDAISHSPKSTLHQPPSDSEDESVHGKKAEIPLTFADLFAVTEPTRSWALGLGMRSHNPIARDSSEDFEPSSAAERSEKYHQITQQTSHTLSKITRRLEGLVQGPNDGNRIEELLEIKRLFTALERTLEEATYTQFVRMKRQFSDFHTSRMRALDLLEQLQITHDGAIFQLNSLEDSDVAERFLITFQILKVLKNNVMDPGFKRLKSSTGDALSRLKEALPEYYSSPLTPLLQESKAPLTSPLGEIHTSTNYQIDTGARDIESRARARSYGSRALDEFQKARNQLLTQATNPKTIAASTFSSLFQSLNEIEAALGKSATVRAWAFVNGLHYLEFHRILIDASASSHMMERLFEMMQANAPVLAVTHPMPEDVGNFIYNKLFQELGQAAEILGKNLKFKESTIPANDVRGIWGIHGAITNHPENFFPDFFYQGPSKTQFPFETLKELENLFQILVKRFEENPDSNLTTDLVQKFEHRVKQIDGLIEANQAISHFISEKNLRLRLTRDILQKCLSWDHCLRNLKLLIPATEEDIKELTPAAIQEVEELYHSGFEYLAEKLWAFKNFLLQISREEASLRLEINHDQLAGKTLSKRGMKADVPEAQDDSHGSILKAGLTYIEATMLDQINHKFTRAFEVPMNSQDGIFELIKHMSHPQVNNIDSFPLYVESTRKLMKTILSETVQSASIGSGTSKGLCHLSSCSQIIYVERLNRDQVRAIELGQTSISLHHTSESTISKLECLPTASPQWQEFVFLFNGMMV